MRVTDHIYVLSGSYYGAVGDEGPLGDVYGIRTGDGLILIDCGAFGSGLATIRETLGYYGIDDPIRYLIITHGHWDHCSNAKELQRLGTKVIVGAEDAPACRIGGAAHLGSPFEEHSYPAFDPDILIENDCVKELLGLSVEFIKTPGHTPGSTMIRIDIDGKKVLFTGDSLQPGGGQMDEVSFGWQGDLGFDRKQIVESMMKLSSLETDIILPGHGKVCLRNGTAMLRFAAQQALLTMR